MTAKALWLHLLLLQKKRSVGLTLPFLVGATRKPPGQLRPDEADNLADLSKILEAMRDATPRPYLIRIGECTRLFQPIAEIHSIPGTLNSKELIRSPINGNRTLYVERGYDSRGALEPVVAFLWAKLGQAITSGAFSYRNKAYCPFDADDHSLIARAQRAVAQDGR